MLGESSVTFLNHSSLPLRGYHGVSTVWFAGSSTSGYCHLPHYRAACRRHSRLESFREDVRDLLDASWCRLWRFRSGNLGGSLPAKERLDSSQNLTLKSEPQGPNVKWHEVIWQFPRNPCSKVRKNPDFRQNHVFLVNHFLHYKHYPRLAILRRSNDKLINC